MGSITGANAAFSIMVTSIFPTPVQLQGFAADDVVETGEIEAGEAVIGVDGYQSAGFVFALVPQTITLQADSSSNTLFDAWRAFEQFNRTKLFAQGILRIPDINTSWALVNGTLSRFTPAPNVKRILQPRRFVVLWESISPALLV